MSSPPRCTGPAGATRPRPPPCPRARSRSSTPSSAPRTPPRSTRPACGSPAAGRRACSTSCAGIVGDEHVLTDHETRLHRTRGKSTPDLLQLRAGDGSDSPDAVVRPATHDEVAALIAWAEERHVALVPFGGGTSVVGGLVARREGFAGVVSLDLVRFDKLLAVDTDSMTATLEPGLRGPAGRGAARRARPDAGPLPAVLRVRLHRRLRGHPLVGPVLGRLRPLRLARRRPARRDAPGRARRSATRRPTPPDPTCARW